MMYRSLGFKGPMDLPGSIRRSLGIGKFRAKVWLLTESGYNRLEYFRAREQRGQ